MKIAIQTRDEIPKTAFTACITLLGLAVFFAGISIYKAREGADVLAILTASVASASLSGAFAFSAAGLVIRELRKQAKNGTETK